MSISKKIFRLNTDLVPKKEFEMDVNVNEEGNEKLDRGEYINV